MGTYVRKIHRKVLSTISTNTVIHFKPLTSFFTVRRILRRIQKTGGGGISVGQVWMNIVALLHSKADCSTERERAINNRTPMTNFD